MSAKGTVFFLVWAAFWIVCLEVVAAQACRIKIFKSCPYGMTDDGVSCWKHTYGRGVGRIPRIVRCPPGLRDDGTSCWSDAHIYGKRCCCTLWGCCRGRCRYGYQDDGCTCRKRNVGIKLILHDRLRCRSNEDLYGTLCYPKCKTGFRPVGCCLCEPRGGPGIKLTLFQRIGVNLDCPLDGVINHIKKKLGRPVTPAEMKYIQTRVQQ